VSKQECFIIVILYGHLDTCTKFLINSNYLSDCTMRRSDLVIKGLYLTTVIVLVTPVTTTMIIAQNTSSAAWKSSFDLQSCNFESTGANSYFILEPGHKLILENDVGQESEQLQLVITVQNETKIVNGTETRIVEERETENGELVEISRNYFAVCRPTNDIYYFGEEVDNYVDGEIASHEGAWLAGIDNARAGMIMPGKVEIGLKHYQEVAPGIAEDRAEIISINDTLDTPAGEFANVLKTEETNPLKPEEKEFKYYAPGIGLIQDETLQLVNYTSQSNNE
jgi:hypothetical protein